MNKILLLGISLCMVIAFNSCKPKQSTYKAAYEQAQERSKDTAFEDFEMENEFEGEEMPDTDPISKPRSEGNLEDSGTNIGYPDISESLNIATRQERINPYEGESSQSLKRYNVVIGSFRNQTNATALKERMQYEGYNAILAKNELGMIRVIVYTSDNKSESVRTRNSFKSKYYPNFQDAWILEQRYH
jgi:cell division protein FtsN